MDRAAPRGQVLVIFSILLVILLGFAGIAIDLGRQVAERRHAQTAADAAALAACRELIAGATDSTAATTARQVALANLTGSPSGAVATIDSPPTYTDEDGSGVIDADELVSGIVVAGTKVRVAISSTVDTALAKVVGISTLETGARARCDLQGGPAVPLVARRYCEAPWTRRRVRRPPRDRRDELDRRGRHVEPARLRRARPRQRGGAGPAVLDLRASCQVEQRHELPRVRRARRPELRGGRHPRLLQRGHRRHEPQHPEGHAG